MSVLKSEDFLYFQNKANHYSNVRNARSRIQSHLPSHLRKTIDQAANHNRDLPFNRECQIKFQNQNLSQRITSISSSNKSQAVADGSYIRYNKFERSFRKRNPFKAEEDRLIQIQNNKIRNKIENIKPKVGSLNSWREQYNDKMVAKRNMSRYLDGQKSKGDLQISKQPFLFDSYLKFIDNIEHSSSNKAQSSATINPEAQKPQARANNVKISKQRLFILPSFSRNDSLSGLQNSRSKSLLICGSDTNIQPSNV